MSRQTIAVSVKASKLTARALAYVVAAVGRKIAKEHRKAQTPHGRPMPSQAALPSIPDWN